MPEVSQTITHYRPRGVLATACTLRGTVIIESSARIDDVNCPQCLKLRGVGTPTPLVEVIAEDPELQRLSREGLPE